MKKIKAVMAVGAFMLLVTFSADAQQAANSRVQSIAPYKLEISCLKTTNIIFPYAIISVDRGSKDVLAQKAKGVENILQVKAAKDCIQETNLSVVTSDGRLNSFILSYVGQPSILNYSLVDNPPQSGTIFLSPEKINQAEIQAYARAASTWRKRVTGIKEKDFGIRFQMNGLFVHGDILYCRIRIENKSNINYDIDQLRFFIRDQKKANRTATQEIEVTPAYIQDNADKIEAQAGHTIVFALPKFTIPDKKYLAIQLMEKNGGRHLELHVKNKTVVRSTVL
jgi:conjugative transposon TraN protein